MGWGLGYDDRLQRDVGYAVPAYCDHPGCSEEIDRGLSYVCGDAPHGGERGCGMHFCKKHLHYSRRCSQRCFRCHTGGWSFPVKPDHLRWLRWKATHSSWGEWRREHLRDLAKKRGSFEWYSRPSNRRRYWELFARGQVNNERKS